MIKFTKKTEYALIALEHMITSGDEAICSVREISKHYQISFPLLAKIMQKLSSKGLIASSLGIKGGYHLIKNAKSISLAELVEIFDGPFAITECMKEEETSCPQWHGCRIKSPLTSLNHKIHSMLTDTSIADIMEQNT
jgi:Rrf2 family protein